MRKQTERKLRSDSELTKSEWNEVLWGEAPQREVKYGTHIIKTGKTFRFGKKFAKKN